MRGKSREHHLLLDMSEVGQFTSEPKVGRVGNGYRVVLVANGRKVAPAKPTEPKMDSSRGKELKNSALRGSIETRAMDKVWPTGHTLLRNKTRLVW